MEDSKNEISTTIARKIKALYDGVFSSKQNDLQNPLKKRKKQVHYKENREKILHNKKILYIENKKATNKKEDCDRNIFTELSRCVQEQESSKKEASQRKSDIFSGNIDFTGRECSRQSVGNGDKQSWNISLSAEKSKKNSSKRVKLLCNN